MLTPEQFQCLFIGGVPLRKWSNSPPPPPQKKKKKQKHPLMNKLRLIHLGFPLIRGQGRQLQAKAQISIACGMACGPPNVQRLENAVSLPRTKVLQNQLTLRSQ